MKQKKINVSCAVFPKIRQRVLGLLYGKPDHAFYTNEIIRLIDSGSGVVQRELAKLLGAQLIISELSGNQRKYHANQSSPLFIDLRNIILKTFGLSNIVREALTSVSDHIQFAFIYGSIASGMESAKSDIDLMIISDTLSYAEIFSLLEDAQEKLGRQINPTFYSKAEWVKKRKNKNNFVLQIIKKPKLFLMGTQDDFKKL